MLNATLLPLAIQDIEQAAQWYQSKQTGLGKRFSKQVRSKILFIRQNPLACELRYDNVRCALVDGFPYLIHYSEHLHLNKIIISAVLHASRNPDIANNRPTS